MKSVVLHCVVSLMVYVRSELPRSETVWLQDVTNELQTDKRILGDIDLPDVLTFTFSRGSQSLNLNLKRNYDIDPNADIYVMQKSKTGRVHAMESRNLEQEDVAYYQDVDNGAFMTVRCVRRSSGQCDRVINGNIQIEGRNYDLRPAETGVTLRNLLESNYLLGTKYFIEDQEQVEKRTAAWKGEEERNIKTNYYVEMGILVDSGIWDLHSSLIQISDKDEKDLQVQRNIREYFSHIINGVNLRYKDINDDSISITVTLREFFLFKREDIFPHNMSLVLRDEGDTYIDVDEYLNDIRKWDIDYSDMLIEFDHAMLFTRHDLYEKQLSNNIVVGLSYTGGVCDIGERTSVIQIQDYFQTVNAAAHELGHNLGADHDGENRCIACPAEDLYIMSKGLPVFEKSKPFSRNPWLFSTCSVDLFKSTLSRKNCVTNIGAIYDDAEWKLNVGRPPGRAYTYRQQCQHFKGPNSDFCGNDKRPRTVFTRSQLKGLESSWDNGLYNTKDKDSVSTLADNLALTEQQVKVVSADICLFMKCRNPKTGQCFKESFSAARGTKCGRKKWCIKGQCVSRGGFEPTLTKKRLARF